VNVFFWYRLTWIVLDKGLLNRLLLFRMLPSNPVVLF